MSRSWRLWTPEEDELVADPGGLTLAQVAKRLGRTLYAVKSRRFELLHDIVHDGHGRRPWTGEDDDELRRLWESGTGDDEIAARLGRTRDAVMSRRRDLRLIDPRRSRLDLTDAQAAAVARARARGWTWYRVAKVMDIGRSPAAVHAAMGRYEARKAREWSATAPR